MLAQPIVQLVADPAPLVEGDLLEFAFETELCRNVVDEAKKLLIFATQGDLDFDFPSRRAGAPGVEQRAAPCSPKCSI